MYNFLSIFFSTANIWIGNGCDSVLVKKGVNCWIEKSFKERNSYLNSAGYFEFPLTYYEKSNLFFCCTICLLYFLTVPLKEKLNFNFPNWWPWTMYLYDCHLMSRLEKSFFYCLKSYFETCKIRNTLVFGAKLKAIVVKACVRTFFPYRNVKRVFLNKKNFAKMKISVHEYSRTTQPIGLKFCRRFNNSNAS